MVLENEVRRRKVVRNKERKGCRRNGRKGRANSQTKGDQEESLTGATRFLKDG